MTGRVTQLSTRSNEKRRVCETTKEKIINKYTRKSTILCFSDGISIYYLKIIWIEKQTQKQLLVGVAYGCY